MDVKSNIPTMNHEKLLEKGRNIIGGSVFFSNEKSKDILFGITFSTIPKIDITLNTEETNPPYKINVTTVGMTIKIKTNITGYVDWKATEI